ncbi:MAG TPA: hypothetical protein VHG10_05970 [Glycomyces sp.]|nr:hypothetical protein [Glycomyces sp.]
MTDLIRHVATAHVGERLLVLALIPTQARVRVTVESAEPSGEVIGSVIHLDTEGPTLRVAAPLQAEWAGIHCAAIIEAAVAIWAKTDKDYKG